MVCGWLAYDVRITSQLRILQTGRPVHACSYAYVCKGTQAMAWPYTTDYCLDLYDIIAGRNSNVIEGKPLIFVIK